MAQVDRKTEALSRVEFAKINLSHFNLNVEVLEIEKELQEISKNSKVFADEINRIQKEIHKERVLMLKDPNSQISYMQTPADRIAILEVQKEKNLEEIAKLYARAQVKGQALELKKGELKNLNQDFINKVPLGENILNEAREASFEKRKNARMNAIDKKAKGLKDQNNYIDVLGKVLEASPKIRGSFKEMMDSHKKVKEQEDKLKAQNPKTSADKDKLKDLKDEYEIKKGIYKQDIQNYSFDNGNKDIEKVDLSILEAAMPGCKDPKEVILKSGDVIIENAKNLRIERLATVQYYNEKLGRAFDPNGQYIVLPQEPVQQQPVPQQPVQQQEPVEEQMPVKNTLWNRFKQKFIDFISRFRKEDTLEQASLEDTAPIPTIPQQATPEQDTYSDNFIKELRSSTYIKSMLDMPQDDKKQIKSRADALKQAEKEDEQER